MQTVTIRGIVGPRNSQDPKSSWNIAVLRKNEYSKLPLDQFPITENRNRDGTGVTLYHSGNQCRAALHRDHRGAFNIGSARNPRQFDVFLRNSGFHVTKKDVELKFSGYKVHMS